MNKPKKVLMVCLGNICRSPIAEAVFQNLLKKNNITSEWDVDSAALGAWHVGRSPDYRALKTLTKNNISYNNKARQITANDFETFDFIFGMDEENIEQLNQRAPQDCHAAIVLLGDYDPKGERVIRDPYYDNDGDGFDKCYEICVRACQAFLDNPIVIGKY